LERLFWNEGMIVAS